MNTIGKLLYRSSVILCVVALAIAFPASSAAADNTAARPANAFVAFANDDFNRCEMLAAWTDETGSHPNPSIVDAGNGSDAALRLQVLAGQQSTMSNSGLNASRVMQSASDEDFELEVRFRSPLAQTSAPDAYRMQGVLIRDDSGSGTKWLRVDLNVDNDNIGYYVAYINESGTAVGITPSTVSGNIASISTTASDFTATDSRLRIRYTQATGTWGVAYYLPSIGWSSYKEFTEAGKGFSFNVTGIGVWSGSTDGSDGGPGHTALFDYFYQVPVPATEDSVMAACSGDLPEHFYLPLISR